MRQLKITSQITSRESEAFSRYLTDVAKEGSLLTPQEEIELAAKIADGDEKALKKLVSKNLRFVISVAKQHQNRGATLEDLVNEGNIGLIVAAHKFDPSRGFKFISYAVWWIRQSIMCFLAENSRSIRLPLNRVGDLIKINRVTVNLQQKLDRNPTSYEITEALGDNFNEIYVEKIISAGRNMTSLDTTVSNDNEDNRLVDIIQNVNSPQSDVNLEKEDIKIKIKALLNTLRPRERAVIVKYFGLEGQYPKTLNEIGEELELTRERIRQIKITSLKKLYARASRKGYNELLK